jgi:hypothetical protein
VYSGKIGFRIIIVMIMGNANSKSNPGRLVSFWINVSESPFASRRFNNGNVSKVMINR